MLFYQRSVKLILVTIKFASLISQTWALNACRQMTIHLKKIINFSTTTLVFENVHTHTIYARTLSNRKCKHKNNLQIKFILIVLIF